MNRSFAYVSAPAIEGRNNKKLREYIGVLKKEVYESGGENPRPKRYEYHEFFQSTPSRALSQPKNVMSPVLGGSTSTGCTGPWYAG